MASRKPSEALLTRLRKKKRWTKADALPLLEALERSGGSVSAFAREHRVSAQKIFWWRSQLADEQGEHDEPLSFAPVVVTGLAPKPALIVRQGALELEVLDPAALEPDWLASLLRATREGEA